MKNNNLNTNIHEQDRVLFENDVISKVFFSSKLFHEGGPFHIETSLLICSANQWTGFYMIDTCIMKELTTEHKKTRTFPYLPATFFNENYKKVKE